MTVWMRISIILFLLNIVQVTLRGWSLHRNAHRVYRRDWLYYSPFKATDGRIKTILKGIITGSLFAGVPTALVCLVPWYFGCDIWGTCIWMLINANISLIICEWLPKYRTLRWWYWYLSPPARRRMRAMWVRDGQSVF